jgi:hypothetical protein
VPGKQAENDYPRPVAPGQHMHREHKLDYAPYEHEDSSTKKREGKWNAEGKKSRDFMGKDTEEQRVRKESVRGGRIIQPEGKLSL